MYQGRSIKGKITNNIAYLEINLEGASANVLNTHILGELAEFQTELAKHKNLQGLILHSGKDNFIFGADVTEFLGLFKKSDDELLSWLTEINRIFSTFETLPYPTVAAINGMALGGGLEITLPFDFRICTADSKLGLPETKLGIIPGWGGTSRLPRIAGADHAIEWITSGNHYAAKDAQKIGVVSAVVENMSLLDAAEKIIARANRGELDYKKQREIKNNKLQLSRTEATMVFETAKGFIYGATKGQYPAPMKAVELMQKAQAMTGAEAITMESKAFVELARTTEAQALITVFLGDQYLKKVSKKITANTAKIEQAAVLGAGIMGGGIAYQSAAKGVPIVMKDIRKEALDLGMNEAQKILMKQLERGKTDAIKMAQVISSIRPTLEMHDISKSQMVVEAVVENIKVKQSVLAEVESLLPTGSVLASNTSTISITKMATALKHPENFCGMHFFNPVHMMPLVEVIRGEKTSDETIAKVVAYATQMGKTPIVVNDCAGFLVNRVLFPYFNGFIKLVQDGVDFKRIDKVMEKFGWPMGPAYLLDVVGIDTAYHCIDIMAEAFPDRMSHHGATILTGMFELKRFGQKNKLGFFEYEMDKKGKPKKVYNEKVEAILAPYIKNKVEVTDQEIIERMMFPMIFECVRCLEEKIVNTATEVDMGLLLGLGFPPFRAGALKYADMIGLNTVMQNSQKYMNHGDMYKAPQMLVELARANKTFY
jgi:3-hydroxyacyl-CoA dehydrogenase / enoyl-CoA hydratase / 3-hydroxybutyryl-CoA epimerase / enoyl-CoA isomerase